MKENKNKCKRPVGKRRMSNSSFKYSTIETVRAKAAKSPIISSLKAATIDVNTLPELKIKDKKSKFSRGVNNSTSLVNLNNSK